MNAENLTTVGLIAVLVVGCYFLVIRPTRKRQKEQARTLESATEGARIMTASGVFGTVARMGERQAIIEVSPGVQITVARQAIVSVLTDGEPDEFGPGGTAAIDSGSGLDSGSGPDKQDQPTTLYNGSSDGQHESSDTPDARPASSVNDEEKPPGQR